MPFVVQQTDSGFDIAVGKYPWGGLIAMTSFLAAFSAFLIWIAIRSRDREMIIGMSIPAALAMIGAPLGHAWEYLWHKSRGPALRYNSNEQSFSLPRLHLTIPTSEIETFAVVTGRKQGKENPITQFQVYARDGKTYHLITCRKPSELQPFVRAIQKQTDALINWRSNAIDDDELEVA